ncbi:hypothetical protein IW150_001131, partial [Coemansia sp. RSA 2607]
MRTASYMMSSNSIIPTAEYQFAAAAAGRADSATAAEAEWLELFDPHTNRVVYANI